jgi:phytoene synthase
MDALIGPGRRNAAAAIDRAAARGRASAGSSFHYSFGLLPPERRRGIEAVYAFCRLVDDVTDAGPRDPERAASDLAAFREEIERCYAGEPTLPITRRLQGCIRRFGIDPGPFHDLLDGVAMDLETRRYPSSAALLVYCRRVASAVGHICLPIFGARHPASRDYADHLGIALQLTNILRDLESDAARGRIYVPLDDMGACGYSEAELLRGERNNGFLRLMRRQAERARAHFAAAAAALPADDRPALVPAEVMAAIYRRLLERIEASGFAVFGRRIAVPRLTQIGLALRARVTGNPGP